MNTIAPDIYARIDNAFYDAPTDIWWNEEGFLNLLRTSFNPCRFGYFLRTHRHVLGLNPEGTTALDVGCGGGLLAEEFATAGFAVTGIDPSPNSIATAQRHAERNRLGIAYTVGSAEDLPYPDAHFDVVYCCDVLEHVRDLPKAMAEIGRVLKPGGVFYFDTINRTFLSKLIVIKLWQEWRSTALVQPGLHVHEMFITPKELTALCTANGMQMRQLRGMSPNVNPIKLIGLLRQRAKGALTYAEFGNRVRMVESKDLQVGYMGYAVKAG